jgi:NDP-sugar pyrophosphorylase family protein
MRELYPDIPKAMVPVLGRPFLERQLELLRTCGVQEVVLCLGYKAQAVIDHFGDGRRYGVSLAYSVEDRPLGTGGALRLARPLLRDEFLLLYGDSYLMIDYAAVAEAFRQSGGLGMMTVYRNEGRYDRSNTAVQDGLVVAYDKRVQTPDMVFIDYGLSAFKREALDLLPPEAPVDLSALFQALIARRQLAAYETSQRFYEIGSQGGLRELTEFLERREKSV